MLKKSANNRTTKPRTAESNQSFSDGRTSALKNEDEDEEAYISQVYGTTTEETEHGNTVSSRVFLPTPGGDGNTGLRRSSKLVSREFQRRRALPKTPQSWTMLLLALASASTAYEIDLQHSLTARPIVVGQGR
jgi:hypothetical protein